MLIPPLSPIGFSPPCCSLPSMLTRPLLQFTASAFAISFCVAASPAALIVLYPCPSSLLAAVTQPNSPLSPCSQLSPRLDLPLPNYDAPAFLDTSSSQKQSSWWDLSNPGLISLEGKKAELCSPSPTVRGSGSTTGMTLLRSYSKKKYLTVSHGNESQLQFTVKLQLLFLSKSCLLCWIAAIILEI